MAGVAAVAAQVGEPPGRHRIDRGHDRNVALARGVDADVRGAALGELGERVLLLLTLHPADMAELNRERAIAERLDDRVELRERSRSFAGQSQG